MSEIVEPLDDAPDAEAAEPEKSDDDELQQLASASYGEWSWYVYRIRTPEEARKVPRANRRVLCTRINGPLDVMEIRREFGGGTYEIWGFHAGGLKKRKTIEIAGPRKLFGEETAHATVTTAPVLTVPTTTELESRLERLERLLERALERTTAAPVASGMTVEQVLKLLPLIQPQQHNNNAGEVLGELVGAFKMGAELRGSVEPGEAPPAWAMVLDKLAPSLERLAGAIIARSSARPTPAPGGAPRPAPRPVSGAEVLNDLPANPPGWVPPTGSPAPTPPPPPATTDAEPSEISQVRFGALVDALARAIEEDADPADFAVTVENVLIPAELDQLLAFSADSFMGQLRQTTYPVFAADKDGADADRRARPFIEAVLLELKTS